MDAKLIFFKENGQRKDIDVTKEKNIIGRGEDADIRVPLLSVSRHHCEMELSGETLSVKDLGSSNGTYVNNQRISEATLKAGDRVVVGPVVFTVVIDGEPDAIEPVKTRGQKLTQGSSQMANATGEDYDDDDEESVDPFAVLSAASDDDDDDDELPELAPADDDEPASIDPIAALEAMSKKKDED
jgi:pSer/pThr/pTyr-binding forkhead associated (FHA) protein